MSIAHSFVTSRASILTVKPRPVTVYMTVVRSIIATAVDLIGQLLVSMELDVFGTLVLLKDLLVAVLI